MPRRTEGGQASGVAAPAPARPSDAVRAHADRMERRLAEDGLALRDLGVLETDDPAAALFLGAVERGFYALAGEEILQWFIDQANRSDPIERTSAYDPAQ